MLPELFVVFTLSSVDAAPALGHDAYLDPLNNGDYYLHIEAASANRAIDQPGKLDDSWRGGVYQDEGMAVFEVYVNFEQHSGRIARQEIEIAADHLGNPDMVTYPSHKAAVGQMNADDLLDDFGTGQGMLMAIEHGDDEAMWLDVYRNRPGDYARMQIIYKHIEQERVLTIRGIVLYEETTVDELKAKVDELVARYKGFPMIRYTGAIVE